MSLWLSGLRQTKLRAGSLTKLAAHELRDVKACSSASSDPVASLLQQPRHYAAQAALDEEASFSGRYLLCSVLARLEHESKIRCVCISRSELLQLDTSCLHFASLAFPAQMCAAAAYCRPYARPVPVKVKIHGVQSSFCLHSPRRVLKQDAGCLTLKQTLSASLLRRRAEEDLLARRRADREAKKQLAYHQGELLRGLERIQERAEDAQQNVGGQIKLAWRMPIRWGPEIF